MTDIGNPFQGKIWYFWTGHNAGVAGQSALEYTTNVSDGDNTYPISGKVIDARIGTGDKHEPIRGIDSPRACELHSLVSDYTLHLEYYIQTDDTLFDRIVDKNAYCKLQPLAFCIITNRAQALADRTCWILNGCKPKTVRVSAAFNQLYLITADFSVRAVYSDGDTEFPTGADENGVGSDPTGLTGAYCGFHIAGSISKDGGDVAHVIDDIDITFNHGLRDKFDHDSMEKVYAVEGDQTVEGTITASLDEGGGKHWSQVIRQVEFDLVIDLGGAGAPRITIPTCKWKSVEVDINISAEPMASGLPFTYHSDSSCSDGFITSVPA